MLRFTGIIQSADTLYGQVTLPYEVRRKSRFRTCLANGEEVVMLLPRGQVLRDGDLLASEAGQVIRVLAAAEQVSTARTEDGYLFARACYHLGNRHIALQIGPNWLRYEHDHVLDQMVHELGLKVQVEFAPFEPESGAYHGHGHA